MYLDSDAHSSSTTVDSNVPGLGGTIHSSSTTVDIKVPGLWVLVRDVLVGEQEEDDVSDLVPYGENVHQTPERKSFKKNI